ncbi:MAG: L-seryl-tRNA(Sec) selenium transferase [Myxococcota bacterium]|nr:L-seryl-tRNA(Sec) selenium transferase [Myxococcota bacterium]
MNHELLRSLPGVDSLLEEPALASLPGRLARICIRRVLERFRLEILEGSRTEITSLVDEVCAEAAVLGRCRLRRVINATGIVLHTNMGRAPLAPEAVRVVTEVASGYSNVELDLQTGQRGGRLAGVEEALCLLTSAPAALAVNNNAAAVLLALTALARGKEVVVSRGELVEIGGSFRVPEILEVSGATLVEVGTTNRTRSEDYEKAITEQTALLLRVHPSNFRVSGFTERPSTADLAALKCVLVEDLGSGALVRMGEEPAVMDVLEAGADLVTFSGDKLLGGSQAGLLVGSKELIEACRKHPLYRAMRLDKLALAALEATLRLHLCGLEDEVPGIRALRGDGREAATALLERLLAQGIPASLVEDVGYAGGGSLPGEELPGWTIAIEAESCGTFASLLRSHDPPILVRVAHNSVRIDPRTLLPGDEDVVVDALILANSGSAGHE